MRDCDVKNTTEFQDQQGKKVKFDTINHSDSRNKKEENTNNRQSIYYQIFENNINAVLLISPDGSIHAANSAACNLFGRTEDEIKQIGRDGLVDLTDPRLIKALHERELTGNFHDELTLVQKDGTKFPGEINSFVFKDENGNTRTCMTIQDITERRNREWALRRSEEKFRNVVENAREGIIVIQEGKRVYYNPRWLEIVGYSEEEYKKVPFLSRIHPEDADYINQMYEKLKTHSNSDSEFEFRILNKSNEVKFLTGKASYIQWENQAAILMVLEDITERKKAEKALKESEFRYRELFENMPSGVAVYEVVDGGKDFIFKDFNRAGEIYDKQSREDLIGKSIYEVRSGIENFGLIDAFRKAIKSDEHVYHPATFYKDNMLAGWYDNNIYLLPSGELVTIFRDVTQSKIAEETLKASEAKYKALFNKSIEGIGLSKGNRVISANKALLNIFGYDSIEEFAKIPLLDHIAPESKDIIKNIIDKKQKGVLGPDFSFIYKIIRKDGSTKDLEISGAIIQLEGEEYILSTFRDITEQKRIETALRENEEKLRLMAESIEDVFWMSTPGIKKMIYISPSYKKIWGRSCQSLYDNPQSFLDMVHPEDREILCDTLNEFHSKGMPYNCEYRIQPHNDQTRWIYERGFPVYDDNGNLCYMTGVCTDITSRKLTQDALQENERLLNEVGRIAKIGGWEMDLINRKAKWTKGTYDIVEIDYGEPIPGPDEHLDYYLPEYRPVVEKAINDLIDKDIHLDIEAKARTAKGNIRWFRVIGRAVRDKRICTKLFGTLQDITAQKASEETLKNHGRLLEKQMYLSKTLLDAIPCVAMLIRPITRQIVASNKAAIEVGALPGSTCYETWTQRTEPCPWCMAPKLWNTDSKQHLEVKYKGIVWDAYWIPVSDDMYMHFAFDITERKKIEASVIKYQEQLKSLASQLTLTEEKERHRIATNLHDQIGQYLAVSRIKLVELLNSDISEGTHNTLKLINEWLFHAIKETRSLTFDLSSPILHELGIEKAIAAWLDDEVRKKYKIETEFYSDTLPKSLDDDIQVILFRDIRELLFNVVKHAHANKVQVNINKINNAIKVEVKDDGVGFDPTEVTTTAAGKKKFGLFSIRERLQFFGGHLEIDSAPGEGCRITIIAPLKTKN